MGGDMTGDEFASLLGDFTLSAESVDGERFASHFTEDGNVGLSGAAQGLARETSMTTTGRAR
jgi:hypothetical protein